MYALFTKIYRQRKLFFQNRLSIENKTTYQRVDNHCHERHALALCFCGTLLVINYQNILIRKTAKNAQVSFFNCEFSQSARPVFVSHKVVFVSHKVVFKEYKKNKYFFSTLVVTSNTVVTSNLC